MHMDMTADKILAIPLTEPERLFADKHGLSDQFKTWVKVWHPDKNQDAKAKDVFIHIGLLFQAAQKKAAADEWAAPGEIVFQCADGVARKMRFRKRSEFELGFMFYGRTALTWVVDKQHADLVARAGTTITGLKYSSARMRTEMERFMPNVISTFRTKDDRGGVVMLKTKDVYCLRDVVEAKGGKLVPEHVAWILNRLYNIACFLQWNGLSHNAISLDTVFVSPEHHSCLLLGGWWYAAPFGMKMKAVPARTHKLMPPDLKTGSSRTDLALIRALGRELLGDATGMHLVDDASVPARMTSFLRHPASGKAVDDYKNWGTCLEACFGERRFVKLPVEESDIFND